MQKDKKEIMVVWNEAVSKVGGNRNTIENFQNIAREFKSLAEKERYSTEEINKETNENYESTAKFMVA